MKSKVSAGLIALLAVGTTLSIASAPSTSASLAPAGEGDPTTSTTTTEVATTTTTDAVSTTGLPTTTTEPPTTTSIDATSTTAESTTSTVAATSTTASPTIPAVPPGALGNPKVTVLDRSARLTWSAPTANGGAPVTRYVIERSEVGSGYQWVPIATVTTTSYLATGLVNGRIYSFRVAAENSAGTGPFVEFGGVWIPPPTAPTMLPARPLNGSVALTWRTWPVPSHIGQPIAVRIERSTPGGSGYTWAGTTTPAAGSFVVKGLVNGARYWIRVGFLYRNGQYGWAVAQVTTPRTLPSAPRSPFIIGGHNAIGIEWAPPASNGGASILGYRFQFSRDGRTWTSYTLFGTAGTPYRSTWAILRPDPWRGAWVTLGRRLWVRVAAVNAAGTGPYTLLGSAVPITYPGYPTNVRVTPISGGAEVSWTPPTTNGFSPLAPYEVQVRRRGSTTWTTVGRTTSNQFRVTGLSNGARYCIRVIAWNSGGLGSASIRVGITAGSWAYYDPQGWTCY